MPFPTTSLLDALTYANGSLSGKGAWLGEVDGAGTGLRIVSNHIENQAGGGFQSNYYSTSYAADQEVYATLLALPATNERIIFYVRVQGPGTATFDGYSVTFRNGVSPGAFIERVDDGVFTAIGTDSSPAIALGDKLGVEASGTTITAYHDDGGGWVSRGVATGQSAYNTSGVLALEISGTGNQVDDWSGGSVGGVPPAVQDPMPIAAGHVGRFGPF